MESRSGIITMVTDFGTRDAYVGAMKGVICTILPTARIVDITHEVRPQHLQQAAYMLEAGYRWFPPGTVHMVVVDPGVGTMRRPIAAYAGGHLFVAPDNGVLSAPLSADRPVVHVISDVDFELPERSETFHGRDVFAPAAAHLASGISVERMGPELTDFTLLDLPKPKLVGDAIEGEIVRVDRFGNAISNIPRIMLRRLGRGPYEVFAGDRCCGILRRRYQDVAAQEPVALIGGEGRVEIAVNIGNASAELGIGPGAPVRVTVSG
ncbi:MAG: SAM-dependent chlorinase/fluorinase [Candidatus Eisenbacteria sp.]|nr:SAM-dependent chlorinase/fluorinase [Candidatus Eisenbacteria bacterium]